jgi:hypothetical protein
VVKRGFFQTDLLATALGHGALLTNQFAKGLSGVGEQVKYMGVLYIQQKTLTCQIGFINVATLFI